MKKNTKSLVWIMVYAILFITTIYLLQTTHYENNEQQMQKFIHLLLLLLLGMKLIGMLIKHKNEKASFENKGLI